MRVLSLDGGGIRGYLPALILRELERRAGRPAAELFDLIVGTSTGGIIGIGLAVGRPAGELANFYPQYGTAIFSRLEAKIPAMHRLLRTEKLWSEMMAAARHLGAPFGGNPDFGGNARYTQYGLETALKEILGDARLSQVTTPLVTTTYDGNSDRPVLLSSRDAKISADYDLPLYEVARATSAAPIFFPALETTWANAPRRFIDGGIWANNPSHVALVEALAMRPTTDVDSVLLVSLGTGTSPADRRYKIDQDWVSVAMDTTAVATSVQTGHLVCQRALDPGNYYRLQVVDHSVSGAMDDPSTARLAALATAAQKMINEQTDTLDDIVRRLTSG
jgi:patatin-like phospholipase/acyl hydrolase